MIKRFIAVLVSIAISVLLFVGVSADYVTMLDYGMGYVQYNKTDINYVNGSGDYIDGHYIITYWALDSFDPDYTYTFTFKFKATYNLSNITNGNPYSNYSYYKLSSLPQRSTGIYTTFNKDGDYYKFTAKLNPGLIGVSGFPLYVYSVQEFNSLNYGFTESSWGVYCEYDPGGSKFTEEYLNQIVNAGSGYPVPDGSTLDSSVNSLNSAEGVVKDKSSSLINSVSSEMSDNLSQAKALSTTLKPAAVQINNIYNSFLSVLPAEVKAVFIAVPLLLFVGWLVGRIKE